MVAGNAVFPIKFSLSPGQDGDAPRGRELMASLDVDLCKSLGVKYVVMDKAYEGDETRQLALDLGLEPVVPPKANRKAPWSLNEAVYKTRNEVERLFRRIKGYRRLFTRFEKLDVMFIAYLHLAMTCELFRSGLC